MATGLAKGGKKSSPRRNIRASSRGPTSSKAAAGSSVATRSVEPFTEPIDTAIGSSTPLQPVLDARAPGSQGRYLSHNTARTFRGAALRAGTRPSRSNEITAADLIAAALALPQVATHVWTQTVQGRLSTLGGDPSGFFPDRALKEWQTTPDAKLASKPARVLRWDAVNLIAQASVLRRETNIGHGSIGLRHLCFAALFTRDGHRALEELGLLGHGIAVVADAFCDAIQVSGKEFDPRLYGDDMKAWDGVILRARAQHLLIAPQRRTKFNSDAVELGEDEDGRASGADTETKRTSDPLGSGIDARALADLILLESARPPLAIGLFGSWGSGKSTLMCRLREEIRRQIKDVQEGKEPPDTTSDTKRVRNVAQLEFNAWSYADSQNLWASLTAEIFEQLKAGGGKAMSRARGEELVDEVARKLAQQEGETEAARQSAKGIQQALDGLMKDARTKSLEAEATQLHAVTIAELVTGDGTAFENRLKQALPAGDDAIAMNVHGRGLGRAWWLAKRMYPWWLRLALAALILLIVGVVVLIRWPQWREWWTMAVTIAAPLVSTLLLFGKPILDALRTAGRYDELVHIRRARLTQEMALLQRQIDDKKTELHRAKQEEEERASKAASLAETKGQPARLLQYLLSESADIQSIKQQVGLMATVRRCFETLNALVIHGRTWKGTGKPALAVPRASAKALKRKGPGVEAKVADEPIDRIILYIDDLDRCSAEQVNRVLDAVHLLLAFQCFVVIVAIDARWVRRSLLLNHPQFHKIEGEQVDEPGQPSPSDYLEKIFQIPFWVRPLEPQPGSTASPYSLYLEDLVGETANAPEPLSKTAENPSGRKTDSGTFKPVPPKAPVDAERTRPERVRLTDAERDLLNQLGPLAAKSPRAVKRLVNIYRLIRAGLSHEQEAAFLGSGSKEVPRFCYVLFALALDAGMAVDSVSGLLESIQALDAVSWQEVSNDPDLLLAKPVGETYGSLTEILVSDGRLRGFVAALKALKLSVSGSPDRTAIERAFEITQRYSFRSP